VNGKIEGIPCQLVIDTGSNITIVRPDVIAGTAIEQTIVPGESSLRTVTGESAPVIGRVMLKFRLGFFETSQEVWLAEIADPCIIGLDFLMAHDCHVDIAGGTVRIGSQEIPLVRASTKGEKRCCRVVAVETVVIPARSEFLIPGKLDEEVSSTWGTVGPAQKLNQLQNVLVGGTLVDLRSADGVPVRVMNVSNQSRRVRKGMEVASVEPVEYVVGAEQGNKQSEKSEGLSEEKSNIPMHLQDLFERSKSNLDDVQQNQLKDLLVEVQKRQ
jgi:hypothetical protein